MILGFTGTSHGMTQRQRATVKYLFCELLLTELHHGDCLGADKEAHNLALLMFVNVVVHPPKGIIKNVPSVHRHDWSSYDLNMDTLHVITISFVTDETG